MVNINEQYENNERYWFRRKRIGFGWTPATWEGWAVTGLAMGVVISVVLTFEETTSMNGVFWRLIFPVGLTMFLFLATCVGRGEPQNWRFWEKNKDQDKL